MSTLICPECKYKTDGNEQFCCKCGTKLVSLQDKTFCRSCGAELKPNAQFCSQCGIQRESVSTPRTKRSIRGNIIEKFNCLSRSAKAVVVAKLVVFIMVALISVFLSGSIYGFVLPCIVSLLLFWMIESVWGRVVALSAVFCIFLWVAILSGSSVLLVVLQWAAVIFVFGAPLDAFASKQSKSLNKDHVADK